MTPSIEIWSKRDYGRHYYALVTAGRVIVLWMTHSLIEEQLTRWHNIPIRQLTPDRLAADGFTQRQIVPLPSFLHR